MSKSLKKSLAINSVLLVTDVGAGLILYNFGKGSGKTLSFAIPPKMEFFKMTGVALVVSVLTGLAITKVEKAVGVEIFDETDGAYLDPDSWDHVFTSFKGLSRAIGGGSTVDKDKIVPTPTSITNFLETHRKSPIKQKVPLK